MPYSLSEEQIDFILNDIRSRGIEIEKLKINILDHICCLLEESMNEGDDFEASYKTIIEDFHETGMKGLQKETKGVMKSKHYYKIRGIIYIIFIASLSYNAIGMIRLIKVLLDEKQRKEEYYLIKDATLNDGYKLLLTKLKENYPKVKIKNYLCVKFIDHPAFFFPPGLPIDSFMYHEFEDNVKYRYRDFDRLAASYPNVTFIVAYQMKGDVTDDIIKKYSPETKHLLYIKGMNRLHSALHNSNNNNDPNLIMSNITDPSVFDKDGKVIYRCKYMMNELFFTNKFLKTLPKDQ